MALRISVVAPIVGEKGVPLKVGEKAASHLTPLHAPVFNMNDPWQGVVNLQNKCIANIKKNSHLFEF